MQSADAGEIDAGIAYHYYWYRDRAEGGSDSDNSELHFFGDQDPGAFLSVSGAGILESSEHAEAAEEFVTWLTSTPAQQAMAESYALEYPLNPDAELNGDVKPFDELEPPDRRRLQPQRPAGHRADDRGRPALTTSALAPPTPPLLLAAGVAVALLAVIPLVYVATYTIIIGPAELWDLVVRPRVLELLRNTVTLAVATMAATAVLGIGLAFVVERTDLPARRLWHGLLVAPLAVPAFVNGYAWVSLDRSIHGFGGAWLVVTLSYYPLVYLPAVAALRGLDPALEEASWSLGHTRWQAFARVVLPQLRPALLGGTLLVGLHLLAEFGALALLRFPTFTTAIYDQYASTFNGSAATAMAASWSCSASSCCSPSCDCAAPGTTHASGTAPPGCPSPWRCGTALAGGGARRWARRPRARRADVRPPPLAAWWARPPSSPSTSCSPRPARPSSSPASGPWPRRSPRCRWPGWPCATAAG